MAEKEQLRTCAECKEKLPLRRFTSLPYDQRCDACIPPIISERAAQKKVEMVHKDFHDLIAAGRDRAAMPRIDQMLGEFYMRYGGVGSFVHGLVTDLKKLEADRPGSPIVVNTKLAILKLTAASTKMIDDREMEQLSLEELKEARKQAMLEMLMEAAADPLKEQIVRRLLDARGLPDNEQMVKEALSG